MRRKENLSRRELLKLGVATCGVGFGAGHLACGCRKSPGSANAEKKSRNPNVSADTIIRGGTIVTMDPARPRAEALALSGHQILAVGSRDDIANLEGAQTNILDLEGGMATPGLVDAHGHVSALGRSLEQVDLRGCRSVEEVIERIRSHPDTGAWVRGRGWDQNLWPSKKMPTHEALTRAFPNQPVWLRRVDGHAGWGNAALLAAAGIDKETVSPSGGEILRDNEGNPTGILVDAAMGLVPSSSADKEDERRHIRKAQAHLLARGITGVHDMGVSELADEVYRELAESSGLRIGVAGYAEDRWFRVALQNRRPQRPSEMARYHLSGVKTYADGALGSRGAYLKRPYSDRADHRGLLIQSQEELEDLCRAALRHKWQVATHAIGDGANRMVLDGYAKAIEKSTVRDHRFRVEHCQIMDPKDIPRFGDLSVIASMQPTHATSDMPWVPDRIGTDRLFGAYAWRNFLGAGAHLCFGSDFPVEESDITFGLHAAVSRQDADGNPEDGWLPNQKLTLEEAIFAFTVEAAFACRRESHLGILKEGYRADISCFTENLFEIPIAGIRNSKIRATIVQGEILHRV